MCVNDRGPYVRAVLKERGITQEEAARIVGTGRTYITEILNGTKPFTDAMAYKFWKRLGIEV